MTYMGHVQNGVVVFDNGVTLPEGAAVRVEPLESEKESSRLVDQLLDWAGKGVDLPSDLARRHDYYIHNKEE